MEEAEENTKMFKYIENEKKVDKEAKYIFKEEGKYQMLKEKHVRVEKTCFSVLNCFNVKLVKSNIRRMSKSKIV